MKPEPPKFTPRSRSEEHGSYIIEGLETGRVYRGHFNVVNRGHITNLPDGCVIEIPGYVDHNRHQHAGRRRSADGLRGDRRRQRPRSADGHGSGRCMAT